MSLRTTFIALFFIIGLCAAMLYGVSSYFSRDAGMRSAELAFQDKHQSAEVAPSRIMESGTSRSSNSAASDTTAAQPETAPDLDAWYAGETETAATSLDAWYAAAGASDGPVDTAPRDDSYLINDTEPFVSTDPL
jgi:hypothetical protein